MQLNCKILKSAPSPRVKTPASTSSDTSLMFFQLSVLLGLTASVAAGKAPPSIMLVVADGESAWNFPTSFALMSTLRLHELERLIIVHPSKVQMC